MHFCVLTKALRVSGGDHIHVGTVVGYAEDPARMFEKALLCFNNKLIYSGCDEEYRLNESGNINVPPQITDQFCNGPCLAETQLLLNCINNIFSGFLFDNKASVQAISDTIRAGCSFSRQRGNFNVAQYTSPAPRITISMSFYSWIVFGFCLLLI
ncbi:hypothetical protein CK203_078202 [Vitis vinifera]|uniref:DUF7731 domain-containing protein n=1 Tax=Vitis vinifera TaxID=29760 RepID=A0A438DUJ8_VITVI|nr:hypothetical protein CK203_078202 [Vitis vinifera]